MKRILLLIMSVALSAVLFQACGYSDFDKEREAINQQLPLKNYALILQNADIIRNGKDKAGSFDLITAGVAYYNTVSFKAMDGHKDYDEIEDLYTKAKECFQAARTKDDYGEVVDFLREQNADGITYDPAIPEQTVTLVLDDLDATRGSIYRDQIFAITDAIKKNDTDAILENANIILEGADKAVAYDLVFIGAQYGGIGSELYNQGEYEDALSYITVARDCLVAAKDREGYERTAEKFKQIDLEKLTASMETIITDIQKKLSAK